MYIYGRNEGRWVFSILYTHKRLDCAIFKTKEIPTLTQISFVLTQPYRLDGQRVAAGSSLYLFRLPGVPFSFSNPEGRPCSHAKTMDFEALVVYFLLCSFFLVLYFKTAHGILYGIPIVACAVLVLYCSLNANQRSIKWQKKKED